MTGMTSMNRLHELCVLAFGTALAACGTTKEIGQLDEGSSDDTADDDDSASSQSASASMTDTSADDDGTTMTVGESGTVDDGDTSGSDTQGSDSGTDTGGCNGPSVCDPQPDGATEADFVIDGVVFNDIDATDLELPCTIESVTGDAPVTVTLACTVEDGIVMHTIETNVPTTLNLVPGTAVVFSHFIWVPFWTEEWFSLRLDMEDVDTLLLAGIRGGTILPQQIEEGLVLLAEPFYGNVDLEAHDDVCELEPVCEETGGNFVTSDCGQDRRHAIAITTGGDEALVYDRNTATVGDSNTAQIRVGEAKSIENVSCTDIPSPWYEIVVVNTTEG